MTTLYRFACTLCLLGISLLTKAQSIEQRVVVSYDKSINSSEYTFRATNPNLCDYTVKVDVTDLIGLSSPASLPYIGTVRPGTTNLFTLKPNSPNSLGGTFRYRFTYLRGRMLHSEPKPFVYLLPVSPGKSCLVQETQYIGTALGLKDEALSRFYSLSIQMKAGDSVFAARRGIVVRRVDGITHSQKDIFYVRDVNQVDVFHTDGTFGRYARLKSGSMPVQEGEQIEVGQFIGLISDELGTRPVLFFSVYYLPTFDLQTHQSYKYIHIRPRFATLNQEAGDFLLPGKTYEATRPMEFVTQEMSKRDIKRYFKK